MLLIIIIFIIIIIIIIILIARVMVIIILIVIVRVMVKHDRGPIALVIVIIKFFPYKNRLLFGCNLCLQ